MGPVDDVALAALAAGGTVTSSTLIWKEGMANWQPCREANHSILRAAPVPAAVPIAAGPALGAGEVVCAECGGIFPINDTISIGNARVCAQCKPAAVQKMREGLDVLPHGSLNYAGIWVRFAAVFLDGLILGALNMAMNLAFGLGLTGASARTGAGSPAFMLLPLALTILQMCIALAYETFMIWKYGATLGKMACKVRVVTPDGKNVSFGQSLGRYFAKIVSSLLCLAGYIMAAFDEEKRALHDRMCNTRVVIR